MGRLDNKVLLLTGAASGIGRASALRAAREGAALFLTDVVAAGLEDTAKRASELGAKVEFRAADISDEEQARSSVAACIERFGRLDVLCNNAGIIAYERVHEMSLAFWRRILSVNLDGTFLMTREAIPHLLETKGAIVNLGSTAGLTPRRRGPRGDCRRRRLPRLGRGALHHGDGDPRRRRSARLAGRAIRSSGAVPSAPTGTRVASRGGCAGGRLSARFSCGWASSLRFSASRNSSLRGWQSCSWRSPDGKASTALRSRDRGGGPAAR